MIVPHSQLSPEALQGLIEEFVTRDGTDYGEQEAPLARKVAQVRSLLDLGSAVIVYNEEYGTCTILPVEQVPENLP